MKSRVFDPEKLSITVLTATLLGDHSRLTLSVTALPGALDVTAGLSYAADRQLQTERQTADLIVLHTGLNGEVLISDRVETAQILTLVYLPGSKGANLWRNAIQNTGSPFGIVILNHSNPAYGCIAGNCRVIGTGSAGFGTNGWNDQTFRILMTQYEEVYL